MKPLTILQTKSKLSSFKGTKKKKEGFTLIELVAVMAIIAILAATFVPKFTNYFTEAKKITVLNQAKSVVTAYEAVSHKLTTTEAATTIEMLSAKGMPLEGISIDKIPEDTAVSICRDLLDTTKVFELNDDGTLKTTE